MSLYYRGFIVHLDVVGSVLQTLSNDVNPNVLVIIVIYSVIIMVEVSCLLQNFSHELPRQDFVLLLKPIQPHCLHLRLIQQLFVLLLLQLNGLLLLLHQKMQLRLFVLLLLLVSWDVFRRF